MIDRRNGWAQTACCVLTGNDWVFPNEHILRTVDGGETWKSVLSAPPEQCLGTYFRNSRTAWVASSALEDTNTHVAVFRTRDGGRSWARSDFSGPSPISSLGLSFPNSHVGWLIINSVLTMNSEPANLYRTDDGGAHWQWVNGPGPGIDDGAEEMMDSAARGSFRSLALPFAGDITFRDATTGWLYGAWESTAPAFLFATRDGGKTWNVVTLPLPTDFHNGRMEPMRLPQFFPPNRKAGILMTQFLPATNDATEFYDTHDAGQSWNPSGLANWPGIWSFVSARQGWAWSPEPHAGNSTAPAKGTLYHTDDGGRSWETVRPLKGLDAYLKHGQLLVQLDFVDSQCGWAIARDGHDLTQLIHTTDGGKTWIAIQPKIQNSDMEGMKLMNF